jgi:hypothetical protein
MASTRSRATSRLFPKRLLLLLLRVSLALLLPQEEEEEEKDTERSRVPFCYLGRLAEDRGYSSGKTARADDIK